MKTKRITQYLHYLNATELGKSGTHETYLSISKDVDLSNIFPLGVDVAVEDIKSRKIYQLKSSNGNGNEFRVNKMGELYRDYSMMPGDLIVITHFDELNSKRTTISAITFNGVVLSVDSKGGELNNVERLSPFLSGEKQYSLEAVFNGNLSKLIITFVEAKKKRADSPIDTDYYEISVDGQKLANGKYYLIIGKENVLHVAKKYEYNTVFLEEPDELGKTHIQPGIKLPLQQIYYGTPGSGKSHKVKDKVEAAYPDKDEREKYVFRTTFHPDSDYASFVGCYKPQMKDGAITYEFVPQAFTKAYVQAWNEPERQIYLIVEEINRGNCAQIFGDLFQLLDRKNGVSEYPIDADDDLRQYLEKGLNEAGKAGIANGKIKLPANLNILATMNTSDQSLFPMDSAFKRRWNWECVPIDYNNSKSSEFRISIGDQNYKWLDFLKNVNTHIFNTTGSEDKQMGNFFIDSNVDERQFVNKVMFYLWNDVCKDEVGTKNNFFRNYTNAEKDESVEFSFNDLFSADASHILAMFMEYLDVKADEAAQIGEEPETDGE